MRLTMFYMVSCSDWVFSMEYRGVHLRVLCQAFLNRNDLVDYLHEPQAQLCWKQLLQSLLERFAIFEVPSRRLS